MTISFSGFGTITVGLSPDDQSGVVITQQDIYGGESSAVYVPRHMIEKFCWAITHVGEAAASLPGEDQ